MGCRGTIKVKLDGSKRLIIISGATYEWLGD